VGASPTPVNLYQVAQSGRGLIEDGDGLSITAAHGAILLRTKAGAASEAVRAADVRMYEQKHSGRVPADKHGPAARRASPLTQRAKAWVARRVGADAETVAGVARTLGGGLVGGDAGRDRGKSTADRLAGPLR
jgi:hypothetical protein